MFASEPSGRTYLLSQPGLIQRLCWQLTSAAVDTVARQNCLDALQKLSPRRQSQYAMIQSGVIAWLVTQLADTDALSQYAIEYGTALILNPSLAQKGTDALSQYAIEYGTALILNPSLAQKGRIKCVLSELDIPGVLSQFMIHARVAHGVASKSAYWVARCSSWHVDTSPVQVEEDTKVELRLSF